MDNCLVLEVVPLWVGVTKELKESSKIQILEEHQGLEQCQDFDLILYLEEKMDQSLVNLALLWLQSVKIYPPSRVTSQLEKSKSFNRYISSEG